MHLFVQPLIAFYFFPYFFMLIQIAAILFNSKKKIVNKSSSLFFINFSSMTLSSFFFLDKVRLNLTFSSYASFCTTINHVLFFLYFFFMLHS